MRTLSVNQEPQSVDVSLLFALSSLPASGSLSLVLILPLPGGGRAGSCDGGC